MRNKIKNSIEKALKNLGIEAKEVILEHPADPKMGDYSVNLAFVLAKKEKRIIMPSKAKCPKTAQAAP